MKISEFCDPQFIENLIKNTPSELMQPVTSDSVFKPGVAINRQEIGALLDDVMLPQSQIKNAENLSEFYQRCEKGESCLMLVEHVSNFDYPCLFRLIEKDPLLGPKVAESILPIQGIKLSNHHPFVTAFTAAYSTIVIYPSRAIDQVAEGPARDEIRSIANPINHAAMRELIEKKHKGHPVLLYPAGTRYRPWDPESKKAVREVQSYIKTFDNIIFVTVHGMCLVPSEDDDMKNDTIEKNVILFTASEITRGREYYKKTQANVPEGEDPRDFISQSVMHRLKEQHAAHDLYYQQLQEER